MPKLELFFPIKPCKISQGFGENPPDYAKMGFKGHPGRDMIVVKDGINVSYGVPVRAAHDGKVLALEVDTNGGYTVVLLTGEAYNYGNGQTYFKTVYAHVIPDSYKVAVGQQVKTGDVLASCGASGVGDDPHRAHVHFSLKPANFVTEGTVIPYWANTCDNNGYGGAIDDTIYQTGFFAEDKTDIIINLQSQVSLLQKVVLLLKKLLNL